MAEEVETTMRDGVVLRADVYRPAGGGPWPVLLARTPYGKRDPGVLARLDPAAAARRGYLVVVQDCRGRFRSGGRWVPLAHEEADGADTVRWASGLPESDGRVGMYGPSYLGYTQWAATEARPAALRAAVPAFTWADPADGLVARGGAQELGLVTHWTLTLGVNELERRKAGLAGLNAALANLASQTYWEILAGRGPTMQRLGLPAPAAGHARAATVGVPTLTIAGWFDAFLQGSLDNHVRARDAGAPAALIVGPWTHDGDSGSLFERQLDWLDRFLRPERARVTPELPVRAYVMGAGEWRDYPAWPPESADVAWYLHAGGRLSTDPPEPDAPPDVFRHDPGDPVPTCGGALLMAPGFPAGQRDQRLVEERDDVLVHTSAPLRAPPEVIGRVRVHLVAESTAPSADWVVRLCDVDTSGVSRNVTDGMLRSHPGNQAREHVVDLWSTAHVFRPGHRVRLQIASSCFPRWDRNLSAPDARQTVHHDAANPSRVILPVVPNAVSNA